jgi:lipid II:glycine glycyltransferase (peptidoglycan interpeptide bridge formation enzyme)
MNLKFLLLPTELHSSLQPPIISVLGSNSHENPQTLRRLGRQTKFQ